MGYWKSKVLPPIKKVFKKDTTKKVIAAEACKSFDDSKVFHHFISFFYSSMISMHAYMCVVHILLKLIICLLFLVLGRNQQGVWGNAKVANAVDILAIIRREQKRPWDLHKMIAITEKEENFWEEAVLWWPSHYWFHSFVK